MSDLEVENATTVVEIVLDRSGSMNACRDATIEGLNSYIGQLKEEQAEGTMVGLTLFDSGYGDQGRETRLKRVFFKPMAEVDPLSRSDFSPRGGTPLYDAVGQVVVNLEQALARHDVNPNVLLVIMTDGGNTDHHGHSADQVKDMLGRHEADGWTVVYLGANQDAWSVGSTFGVSKGNAISYDTGRMDETFKGLARSTVAYASAATMAGAGQYATRSFFADGGVDEDALK